MRTRNASVFLAVSTVLAVTAGCDDDDDFDDDDDDDGAVYDPDIPDDDDWAAAVTNPLFPLAPGTVWRYVAETADGTEEVVVEVLVETREIEDVDATVVRDQVILDGELVEDTYDWFAQDEDGNVWFLGEDTRELEAGTVVSTDGSWEWGKGGALPGIIMWADPAAHLGVAYRQEYSPGVAEDWGRVLALDKEVQVPLGTFTGCLQTEDWNGLVGRAASLEHKYYCPGIGTVLEVPADAPEERVKLVGFTRP